MPGAPSGCSTTNAPTLPSADARLAKARTWDDTTVVLAKSRQTVVWEALGQAIAAYEAALTYSLRQEQFGRPLARFQLIQDKLSHMATSPACN